jgi:hypothetical protein
MKNICRVVDRVFYHITENDWDGCYLITGDEGKSKSTLGLHIIDRWIQNLKGEVKEEDAKYMALSKEDFVTELNDLKQFEAIDYDEAGDLSNKRTMSKFNFLVTKAYQVIRGDNLFTLLTIPSLFDLDPFFSRRRVKGLFHVYERGKCAFYNQKRVRMIVALNQYRQVKSTNIVSPLFRDKYPIYKGKMKDMYLLKKAEKMKTIRQELYDEMFKEEEKNNITYDFKTTAEELLNGTP